MTHPMTSTVQQALAMGIGIGIASASIGAASACTSFTLRGNDGGRVYGRTMEFAQPLNSEAVLIQRGTLIKGAGPSGKEGTPV